MTRNRAEFSAFGRAASFLKSVGTKASAKAAKVAGSEGVRKVKNAAVLGGYTAAAVGKKAARGAKKVGMAAMQNRVTQGAVAGGSRAAATIAKNPIKSTLIGTGLGLIGTGAAINKMKDKKNK